MSALKNEDGKPQGPATSFPARPQSEADLKAIRADINRRFSKSLEYLGR